MAHRRFRIGFDMDDVLINTADCATSLYNDIYGTKLTRENWYDFDPITPWGAETLSEVVGRVTKLIESEHSSKIQPIKDSQHVLHGLSNSGHSLFVITGRPESIRAQTMLILDRLFPGTFSYKTLFFTDHYNHDGRKCSKADIALDLRLTHYIDDQLEHAEAVLEKGVKTILFSDNYKWNKLSANDNLNRLSSWQEIEEFFDEEQQRP